MKRYNITTVSTYEKNGEEKKSYPQVGKLVKFEATSEKKEGFILELNMFPNTKFFVFEEESRGKVEEKTVKTDIGTDVEF